MADVEEGGPVMMEHGLAWVRHAERLAEMESIARERELARAVRVAARFGRPSFSIRQRIGYGLIRVGRRIAAGAGS